MADLSTGADAAGGERFGNCEYNDIKNHWRMSDPTNPANLSAPQPGMIVSDEDDEKLYHRQAGAWQEIIQTGTPISDDAQIIGGDGSDSILIPYEETTNDAVIWGIPVAASRGLIFCDVADIAGNFAALITASTHPMVSIVDLDIDSYLSFGYAGDNLPDIWSNRTLNLQYEALAGVNFFAGAAAGENPYVYIYGWETGRGARQYTRFQMSDTNNEFVIEAENNADHEGITIKFNEAGQRFRIRQGGDILSWYLDGTDAFMKWSNGQLELQTDETNATTVVRIKPNGTSEVSQLDFYDADGIRLSLYTAADRAYIESVGGVLGINPNAAQNVAFFENASSGETPEVLIYGFRGADALRSLQIGVGVDADDTASFDGVSNYYFDGNVGIGDFAPSEKLSIYSNNAALVSMRIEQDSTGDASIGFTITATAGWILGIDNSDDDKFKISNSGTDLGTNPRITLDQVGNVGIAQTTFGANMTNGYAQATGVAPTASPADCFQMWSADVLAVAGKAGPHWRSEEDGMYAWHGGAGTINSFTYQADVVDDGTFNLPAITDAAWGFIQAGNNEEYALFTIDDDGDVTLISNSANVVANADIDGKICLGTNPAQEPLQIRNRLNATKNINLIIWHS